MGNETFSVGEIAIWQNLDSGDETCNGQECTVIGPLEYDSFVGRKSGEVRLAWAYPVEDSEGTWYAFPEELRKKRPPPQREPTSTWDDVIVWRPKETAHV